MDTPERGGVRRLPRLRGALAAVRWKLVVLLSLCGLALCPASSSGQYRPDHSPIEHSISKAMYATAAYAMLREGLGQSNRTSAVAAVLGTWATGIIFEAAKGHKQPVKDKVHDLMWHGLIVVPLATRKGWTFLALAGGIGVTRTWAIPRW